MTLSQYLETRGLSYAEFARMIDAKSAETVRRYATSGRVPNKDNMARIVAATDSAVTPNDFHAVAA